MFGFINRLRASGDALSAILYGAAHAFDMGGTLAHERGRFGMGPQGDVLALRHDWARAANGAWRTYEQAPE
jgi:hypothetical protein